MCGGGLREGACVYGGGLKEGVCVCIVLIYFPGFCRGGFCDLAMKG